MRRLTFRLATTLWVLIAAGGQFLTAPARADGVPTAPSFVAFSPPDGVVSVAYSYQFTATGDPVPTFSLVAGSLPPGLSLDPTSGILAGTPTTAGDYDLTIDATNGVDPPDEVQGVLEIAAPAAWPFQESPIASSLGLPYSFQFTATGFPAPTYALTGGSLPPGLSLSSGGLVSGTPTEAGAFSVTVAAANGVASPQSSGPAINQATMTINPRSGPHGYVTVDTTGAAVAYGATTIPWIFTHPAFLTSLQPGLFVAAAANLTNSGIWEASSDGGVLVGGDAHSFGSMAGRPLNKPIVGIAATVDGQGYWLVASDGGIFGFGDAVFHGSMGGSHLNRPIVGIAATPDGQGYWEVASDGGLFSFGSAGFFGSMGGSHLNQPVVGMSVSPDGQGYREVASDGGLFSFGTAGFFGSTGGSHLNQPVVSMAASGSGRGYWELAADGGIFAFGDAPFLGANTRPFPPMVAIVGQ